MARLSSLLSLVALGLATLGLAAPSNPAANLPRAPVPGTPEFLCKGARHYEIEIEGCGNKERRDEAGTAEFFKRNKGFRDWICEQAEKHHVLLGGCENIETPDEWMPKSYPGIDVKKRAAGDELGRSKMCSMAEELGIEVDVCNDD